MRLNTFRTDQCNKRCAPMLCLLFNVYVNELSECLTKSGIEGKINGTVVNHMLYADDICIISLSSVGLQKLLNIIM